ncbi:hypothetical protein [Bradyrhizobium sp. 18]|uniref:hypothetical protein n=1 Tax=Bradyrhizobium sp. 18 TaxID=2782657 RepID=UPI001FF8C0CE|nr:hypothetical protein [Bradyrhizobium sp. 18]MCK1504532.1 hypothetical protein [Bradyrhizobium sp. 18]
MLDRRPDNRKADLIRKIANEVESRVQNNRDHSFWSDENGILGLKVQNEILACCLGELKPQYSKNWIAKQLFGRLDGCHPYIRGKRASRQGAKPEALRPRWKASSYNSWLTNNTMQPEADDAQRVLTVLVDLAAENLVRHANDIEQLKAVIWKSNRSIHEMVYAIVHATVLGDNARWKAPKNFIPCVASSLKRPPEAAAPGPLLRAAQEAVDYLAGIEGPRLVTLTGPSHSGKKTAIRYLLARLPKHYLPLVDGTLLPTLALNLEELTPDEFVDQVYEFYKSDNYTSFGTAEQLPASLKVERIRRMARSTPACVILGEIGLIDAEEIGRRLSGAYAEEVVSSLLEGHDLTRLILANHDGSTGSFLTSTALLGEWSKTIELPGEIPQSDVRRVLSIELRQLEIPENVIASGLCWSLCHTALLLAEKKNVEADSLQLLKQTLKGHLQREDRPAPEKQKWLLSLIVDQLSDQQRLIVGMICSSPDGLRFSVLEKMTKVYNRLAFNQGNGQVLTREELRRLLSGLDVLIQGRVVATDRVLVDFGALIKEHVYTANESWRRLFFAEWQSREPQAVALVMWLIAREAGDQSRWMRVHAGARTPASTGRDVQALHAAVIAGSLLSAAAEDQAGKSLCSEADILPSLGIDAPVPLGQDIIGYAFRQLYIRDLEGDDFQLLNLAEDARTRLRLLLTFLSPHVSWRSVQETPLSENLSSYSHLTNSLTPFEMLELLTSIGLAALRLQRFDVLSPVCRLGEKVFGAAADPVPLMPNLMRLLRSETDAARLLGGNPDVYLKEKAKFAQGGSETAPAIPNMTLSDIGVRLRKLLDEVFVFRGEGEVPVEVLLAQGVLHARLGEVQHAAGLLFNAGMEFEAALKLENDILSRMPPGSALSPVLGGRSRRSYVAYCIDRARSEQFDQLWNTLVFIDNLPIPISRRIPLNDAHIVRAMRSFEINARGLHNGRAAEKVSLQIDGARFAVVDHQYSRAFRLLDAANGTRFGSGSSLEILLELFAIQTRYSLDAAVICLNKNAKHAVFASEDFISGVREYFGLAAEATPLELAARLLDRATENHRIYGRLALLHGNVMTPHVTYMRYLAALHLAISSRMTDAPKEYLEKALFQLVNVVKHMELSGFLLHLQEAKNLSEGIANSLRRYNETSAG